MIPKRTSPQAGPAPAAPPAEALGPAAPQDALQALHLLQEQLDALAPPLPTEAPVAGPAGRERERLLLLRRAAMHIATLPRRRGAADQGAPDELLGQALALRRQAGRTLLMLGQHAEAEVPTALHRALQRWDQAGELDLLPAEGRQAALALQGSVQAALERLLGAGQRDAAQLALLAAAAEAMLAVDSACALLRAVETRFTALLRAQWQRTGASDAAEQRAALLPQGRPFIEVGRGLSLAGRLFHTPGEDEAGGTAVTEDAA